MNGGQHKSRRIFIVRPSPRQLESVGWALACLLLLVLLTVRFRAAVLAPHGPDLDIFIDAAGRVVDGHPPWEAKDYVYSPFVAIALAPIASSPFATEIWVGASLLGGVVAIVAFCATVMTAFTQRWMRPLFFAVCCTTLFYSWPVTVEMFFGQTDLYVLAAFALAGLLHARRHPLLSGVLLGLAGLVKTWPAATTVWAFRRRSAGRIATIAGAAITIATGPVVTLVLWGPNGLSRWITTTFEYSGQDIVSYSVWGFPRNLFGRFGDFPPVIESRFLQVFSGVVLGLFVIVLLCLTLLRPGNDIFSLWNVVACVVLLLPVSHLAYRLLMVPVLWMWVAHLFGKQNRTRGDYANLAVMFGWWVLVFRVIWPGGAGGTTSSAAFLVIMGATFLAVAVSICRAAAIHGQAKNHSLH